MVKSKLYNKIIKHLIYILIQSLHSQIHIHTDLSDLDLAPEHRKQGKRLKGKCDGCKGMPSSGKT